MQPISCLLARQLFRRINVAVVTIAIGLTGCANVENFVRERQEARELTYLNSARESCKRYGFVENTDAFAQCIQNDINAAKARQAIEDAASPVNSRTTSTSCTKTLTGMDCTTR